MNSSLIVRTQTGCAALVAMILMELMFPMAAHTAAGTYQAQANDLFAKFHLTARDQSGSSDNIKQEINALQAQAADLDQLQAKVDALQSEINGLNDQIDKAQENVNTKGNQVQSDVEAISSEIKSIIQQAKGICGQLNGAVYGESGCVFSCPEDAMGPCQTKKASYDQQTAQLTSRLTLLEKQRQSDQDDADAAASSLPEKQQQLEDKNNQLKTAKDDLAGKKEAFDDAVSKINVEIAKLPPPSLVARLGQAWQDLNNVMENYFSNGPNSPPQKGNCYDGGCKAVILPSSSPPPTPPAAAAQSPAYINTMDAYNRATEQEAAARQAFKQVASSSQPNPQELQQRYNDLMAASKARATAFIRANGFAPISLKPIQPKKP